MNRIMNSMMKRITVPLLLAACPVYLTMQPFAAFAASVKLPGTVTAWGYNGLGCLGDGTSTSSSKPVSVILPPGVTASAIAAGQFHNMAITDDGLYQWGDGVTTPMKVAFPATVITVIAAAGGMYHSLALTDDGVYAWGGNGSGQLGDGTATDSAVPVKVLFPTTVTTVTAIAAGFWHSLAIGDNSVHGWGYNGNGELGAITAASTTVPVKAVFPKKISVLVTAIAAGSMHSLALTDNGLYAWGNNSSGQLGIQGANSFTPTKVQAESNVIGIGAGYYHSLALH